MSESRLDFIVYGSPVAQPRTKAQGFIKNGRVMAHVYEPGKKDSPARQWKSDVKMAAVQAIQKNGWKLTDAAIRADITAYFPRPKYMMSKKYPDGPILHTRKPDRDNCEKGILDSLKGVAFVDDCQVCAGEVTKFYAAKGEGPKAKITLEVL